MSQAFQAPINLGAIDLPNSGSFFDVEGQFKMIVEKAEFKSAKNNQANMMLSLTLKIIEGEHAGKRGNHNLNLYNSNQDAVKIAYSELAAYATAMGAPVVLENTGQLCGKPFCVYVTVKEEPARDDPNKTYKNNRFSDWAYADGTPIVRGQFGATQGQPAQAGYAAPGQAPAPQAPVAPVAAPVAPAAPQQGYAAPQAPAAVPQQAYAAPAAPAAAPVAAPQAAPQQPAFAPPAGAAPFAPPQA